MVNLEKYKGAAGDEYLGQRTTSHSDAVQTKRATLFEDMGDEDSTLLDFGCGTGGILSKISARKRIGVEVGAEASEIARRKGIHIVEDLGEISDNSVDAAISFHALEHVDCPLHVVKEIYRVLKVDGGTRIVVPCEMPVLGYQRGWVMNSDWHLYTWTPLLLGNLMYKAGFDEIHARVEPMPTNSRLVRALKYLPWISKKIHLYQAVRKNRLNVVVDCKKAMN